MWCACSFKSPYLVIFLLLSLPASSLWMHLILAFKKCINKDLIHVPITSSTIHSLSIVKEILRKLFRNFSSFLRSKLVLTLARSFTLVYFRTNIRNTNTTQRHHHRAVIFPSNHVHAFRTSLHFFRRHPRHHQTTTCCSTYL